MELWRTFFDNRDQLAEDLGITTPEGRWQFFVDLLWFAWFYPGRAIWFNILWFVILNIAFFAAAYHVLVIIRQAMS
jgi:hypothetical protein